MMSRIVNFNLMVWIFNHRDDPVWPSPRQIWTSFSQSLTQVPTDLRCVWHSPIFTMKNMPHKKKRVSTLRDVYYSKGRIADILMTETSVHRTSTCRRISQSRAYGRYLTWRRPRVGGGFEKLKGMKNVSVFYWFFTLLVCSLLSLRLTVTDKEKEKHGVPSQYDPRLIEAHRTRTFQHLSTKKELIL